MGDRGTPRKSKNGTGKSKTPEPPKPRVPLPSEPKERYEELIRRAETYLVAELERVVEEEGNSSEAIRLRRHFVERLAEASVEGGGQAGEAGAQAARAPGTGPGWLQAGVDG